MILYVVSSLLLGLYTIIDYRKNGLISSTFIIGALFTFINIVIIITGDYNKFGEDFIMYIASIYISVIVSDVFAELHRGFGKSRLPRKEIKFKYHAMLFFVLLFAIYKHYEITNFIPPITYLSNNFAAGIGSHYSEYNLGILTAYSFAAAKILPLLYMHDMMCGVKSKAKAIISLISVLLVFTLGLRNVLLWPLLFYLVIKSKNIVLYINTKILLATIILSIAFVNLGNYRLGEKAGGNPFAGRGILESTTNTTLIWSYLYTAPSLLNLNNLFEYQKEREISYGNMLLQTIVPFTNDNVKNSITVMVDNGLLEYYGITFRTIYSDLLIDFGVVGSIFVGMILMYILKIIFISARKDYFHRLLYASLIPGIIFFPFLNLFTGFANMLPIVIVILVYKKYA